MKNTPVFNIENIIEICGGDKTFIAEIIDLFIVQAEPQVSDLDKAVAENDNEKFKKAAHKFKSSALLFDIPKLIELLAKIENNGIDGLSEKELKMILKKIRKISEESCIQLKKIRKDYD